MKNPLPSCVAMSLALCLAPLGAGAEQMTRLHGVETGYLLPPSTLEFRLGSHQANPGNDSGIVGTGLQVYEGGVTWRGNGPWQFGARFSVYDDAPPAPIAGAYEHLSFIGLGLDAKRELAQGDSFSWAFAASIEGLFFGTRIPVDDSTDQLSGSLRAPLSLRLSPTIEAHLDPSLAVIPNRFKGDEGFGVNAFLGAGLAWQATPRLTAWAELQLPLSGNGNTLDESGDVTRATAWSAGARIRVAPAADLDLYLTNRVAGTAASSGMVLPPGGDETMVGAQLIYRPGREDTSWTSAAPTTARPHDGIMLGNGAILPLGETRARAGLSGDGGGFIAVSMSPDTALQFDAILERHASASDSLGFDAPETDTRYMLGGRLQLGVMSTAAPVWLSAGVLAGRDIEDPTIGVIYADLTAGIVPWDGASITVKPHTAAWGEEHVSGLGLGLGLDLGQNLDLVTEASLNGSAEDTWAAGLRWTGNHGISATLYATNAVGLNGHGTLIAAEDERVGFGVETAF